MARNYCGFPGKFTLAVCVMEVGILILFAFFVRYNKELGTPNTYNPSSNVQNPQHPADAHVEKFYSLFQDVHIMMFIGFGFLMTFLKRYGFSSVGFNFLIAAFVIQWQTLISGFINSFDGSKEGIIRVDVETMTSADFAAAAVLISFGAVLGKTSPLQMLIMVVLEVFMYEGNYRICIKIFEATDVGDSMVVHMFGAYFGLAVAFVLYAKDVKRMDEKEGSVYQSDLFSMIGTVFLWICWPSFNGSAASGDARLRAIVNTYYALTASCVTTFIVSSLVGKKNKFSMVHVQNSTLAGGVAVGSVANMMIQPWAAMLIGIVAGTVSVLGYEYLTPLLARIRIHDTCGVNNLHGMPGIISGLGSILAAGVAWDETYNYDRNSVFPSKSPSNAYLAGAQAICFGISLGIAIFGGLITGLILKLPFFDRPTEHDLFDDDKFWLIPVDESLYLSNDDFNKKRDAELTHI